LSEIKSGVEAGSGMGQINEEYDPACYQATSGNILGAAFEQCDKNAK
jgi:hypothetical protein